MATGTCVNECQPTPRLDEIKYSTNIVTQLDLFLFKCDIKTLRIIQDNQQSLVVFDYITRLNRI